MIKSEIFPKFPKGWTEDRRTEDLTVGRRDGDTDGWISGHGDGQMVGHMDGRTHEWIDKRTDRQTNGRTYELMDGWAGTEGHTN